ncbi:MAG: hypothetical protein M1829_001688 [Trizodia sp. TS-e1964]|nr:MAG: hypothetical protein M1829_001688 [Trizodia sp. TS-e1964]
MSGSIFLLAQPFLPTELDEDKSNAKKKMPSAFDRAVDMSSSASPQEELPQSPPGTSSSTHRHREASPPLFPKRKPLPGPINTSPAVGLASPPIDQQRAALNSHSVQQLTICESIAVQSSSPLKKRDSINVVQPLPKQKQSKWKILGGLFGKKNHRRPTPAFYQLQAQNPAENPSPPIVRKRSLAQSPSALTTSLPRKKSSAGRPPLPSKDNNNTLERSDSVLTNPHSPDSEKDTASLEKFEFARISSEKPIIKVDIPNVSMERYSVMFGSLLKSNQEPALPQPPQPVSLLARRQARLEKLKTIEDDAELVPNIEITVVKPWRPTSSAVPSPSPSFSLFPPPSGCRFNKDFSVSPISTLSPRQRASTITLPSPCSTPTPNRLAFPLEANKHKEGSKILMMVKSPIGLGLTTSPLKSRRKYRESRKDFNKNTSYLSLESSGSEMDDDSDDDDNSDDMRSSPREESYSESSLDSYIPPGETANSKHSKTKSTKLSAEKQDKDFEASASGLLLTFPSPPSETYLEKAADISIARQISISSQQRTMLMPIVPLKSEYRAIDRQRKVRSKLDTSYRRGPGHSQGQRYATQVS